LLAFLRVFGGLSVETADGPLTGRAAQRHRLALLALLASGAPVGREKLVTWLWPDADSERGRRLLSDSAYRINRALGEDTLVAAGDELRLNLQRLPCDLPTFELAAAAGRPEAAALYAGPFLDGFFLDGSPDFEQWCARERDRLAQLFGGALRKLAQRAELEGDVATAASWWHRAALHEPLDPAVALGHAQALARAGDRAAALRHAAAFTALVREELGVDPDPALEEFTERLRSLPPLARVRDAADAILPQHAGENVAPEAEQAADAGSAGRVAEAAEVPGEPARTTSQAAAHRASKVRVYTAALVVSLVLLAVLLVPRLQRGGRLAANGVAVLSFADHSPARDHGWLASGVAEEVAGSLSRMGGLRVVSSLGAADPGKDFQRLGQRLRVEVVLDGSISRWGDSVRVDAWLVRIADSTFLWSATYTRPMGSILAIRDSIARSIDLALRPRAAALRGGAVDDRTGAPGSGPEAVEAYNLYLRGRYAWHRRTQESLAAAVAHFEEAVTLAPDYARAHAGLADAYAVQGFYYHRAPADAFTRAEASARRALQIDAMLAQPHATLGYVSLYYHWDWAAAERGFARALELDPAYSTAHQWQANYHTAMGRFAEAERAMRRAMELDPLSLIANGALGWVFYHAGEFDRAIEQCNRTLELDADFQLAYVWSALAHMQAGRSDTARVLLERAVTMSPGSAMTRAALAHTLASAGQVERARALLDSLTTGDAPYVPPFEVAKVHLALGDRTAAMEWLEQALAQRSHSMAFLKVDPQLAPLRNEPRFRALLRRVGHS
jgi:DNA-binding SARP family transcriptional activator/TolB-like protein/Tfp pilus assembly protein PilF